MSIGCKSRMTLHELNSDFCVRCHYSSSANSSSETKHNKSTFARHPTAAQFSHLHPCGRRPSLSQLGKSWTRWKSNAYLLQQPHSSHGSLFVRQRNMRDAMTSNCLKPNNRDGDSGQCIPQRSIQRSGHSWTNSCCSWMCTAQTASPWIPLRIWTHVRWGLDHDCQPKTHHWQPAS